MIKLTPVYSIYSDSNQWVLREQTGINEATGDPTYRVRGYFQFLDDCLKKFISINLKNINTDDIQLLINRIDKLKKELEVIARDMKNGQ